MVRRDVQEQNIEQYQELKFTSSIWTFQNSHVRWEGREGMETICKARMGYQLSLHTLLTFLQCRFH